MKPYYKPKSENYPDIGWLLFNCSERDQKLARTAFIREYGPGRWEEFRNERLSTGIMELFQHPQDELAVFYANFIGKRVDERALKAAEAAEKAAKTKITVVLNGLHKKDVKDLSDFLGPLADDGYVQDLRGTYSASDSSSGDTNRLEITINTDPAKSAQGIRKAVLAFAMAVGKRS